MHFMGEDNAGSLCCKQGPVSFDLHMNQKGYVPGEVIYIDGTISNYSLSATKYTEAKLIRVIMLYVFSHLIFELGH